MKITIIGKVAVVTGSSRSTGAEIAREHGAHVVVNYFADALGEDYGCYSS